VLGAYTSQLLAVNWSHRRAVGNSLNAVAANGSISNLAFFPNRTVSGSTFQAVPTGVVQGLDGQLYVGQLTGFPFLSGQATCTAKKVRARNMIRELRSLGYRVEPITAAPSA